MIVHASFNDLSDAERRLIEASAAGTVADCLDFADLNARLAAEYMRGILEEAAKLAVVRSSA